MNNSMALIAEALAKALAQGAEPGAQQVGIERK